MPRGRPPIQLSQEEEDNLKHMYNEILNSLIDINEAISNFRHKYPKFPMSNRTINDRYVKWKENIVSTYLPKSYSNMSIQDQSEIWQIKRPLSIYEIDDRNKEIKTDENVKSNIQTIIENNGIVNYSVETFLNIFNLKTIYYLNEDQYYISCILLYLRVFVNDSISINDLKYLYSRYIDNYASFKFVNWSKEELLKMCDDMFSNKVCDSNFIDQIINNSANILKINIVFLISSYLTPHKFEVLNLFPDLNENPTLKMLIFLFKTIDENMNIITYYRLIVLKDYEIQHNSDSENHVITDASVEPSWARINTVEPLISNLSNTLTEKIVKNNSSTRNSTNTLCVTQNTTGDNLFVMTSNRYIGMGPSYREAFNNDGKVNEKDKKNTYFSIGYMSYICEHCDSFNFRDESKNTSYKLCCHKGKIMLEKLKPCPALLKDLLIGTKSPELKQNYIQNIRKYNSCYALASVGINLVTPPGIPNYTFLKAHGQILHRISTLYPKEGIKPVFGQLYVLDTQDAIQERLNNPANVNCNENIMSILSNIMNTCNPYALLYKNLHEKQQEEQRQAQLHGRQFVPLRMYLSKAKKNQHPGRYNDPISNEIAVAFLPDDHNRPPTNLDIVVYPYFNNDKPINLHFLHPWVDPFCYPLLFPYGEEGFELNMSHDELFATKKYNKITARQFYSFRLAVRKDFSILHHSGKLFQQYAIDAFVKIEGNDLNFLRKNQDKLRVDTYGNLLSYINDQAQDRSLQPGSVYILPSTYVGSPRWYSSRYHDAMAVVKKLGRPTFFITFTCNSKWPEITEQLLSEQSISDRPDIVNRVFHLKRENFTKDLTKFNILGKCIANVHTIEWQKRGLPHNHDILWTREEDQVLELEIDNVICAEIPDQKENPKLYEIVKKFMIHGPCGSINPNAICMENGKCSKHYPKEFNDVTKMNVNGYPLYRRRNDGRVIDIPNKGTVDNRWVVPYNPTLSLKYNCHINVELCSTIKSVKYVFKYVFKGPDSANIVIAEQIQNNQLNWDEIKTYTDSRYVSSSEACYRIFEFPLSENLHTIYRLEIHLPNEQKVKFIPTNIDEALETTSRQNTMLTGWFDINSKGYDSINDIDPRNYLYINFPYYYVWNTSSKNWTVRKKVEDKVIPRLYHISPSNIELFHLRLLLCHVRGATSFEDLKTVDGTIYHDFREAAEKLGLVDSSKEWDECLKEAASFKMPHQCRQLLATIFLNCNPANYFQLWNNHKESLKEDFFQKFKDDKLAEHMALYELEKIFNLHQKSNKTFNLPSPDFNLISNHITIKSTFNITNFTLQEHIDLSNIYIPKLNQDQKHVFDNILKAIDSPDKLNNLFFLDGPGGTGKTFVFSALIHFLRARDDIVVPIAHTGIAASLVDGGRTVHSVFDLALDLHSESISPISPSSVKGKYLSSCKLILWDEATMSPSHAFNAVDRLLQDLMNNKLPFGGKVVLMGGDFRQTLPVVKNGAPLDSVNLCLKRCLFWPYVKQFALKVNMRANKNETEFKQWLLDIGDGKIPIVKDLNNEHTIELNSRIVLENSDLKLHEIYKTKLINFTYGNSGSTLTLDQVQQNVCILSPKNENTRRLNEDILNLLPGNIKTYYSIDKIDCEDDFEKENYTSDYVNSLQPNGSPPHALNLKNGCICVLLRNMNVSEGLCNGTRLKIITLGNSIIEAEIFNGFHKGKKVFIPRFKLNETEDLPFTLTRIQFPIILAFAMTINKSQGQTFDRVGVFLPEPVFSHGQLYVAFSRVKSFECLKVLVGNTNSHGKLNFNTTKTYTHNIVYRNILSN